MSEDRAFPGTILARSEPVQMRVLTVEETALLAEGTRGLSDQPGDMARNRIAAVLRRHAEGLPDGGRAFRDLADKIEQRVGDFEANMLEDWACGFRDGWAVARWVG